MRSASRVKLAQQYAVSTYALAPIWKTIPKSPEVREMFAEKKKSIAWEMLASTALVSGVIGLGYSCQDPALIWGIGGMMTAAGGAAVGTNIKELRLLHRSKKAYEVSPDCPDLTEFDDAIVKSSESLQSTKSNLTQTLTVNMALFIPTLYVHMIACNSIDDLSFVSRVITSAMICGVSVLYFDFTNKLKDVLALEKYIEDAKALPK